VIEETDMEDQQNTEIEYLITAFLAHRTYENHHGGPYAFDKRCSTLLNDCGGFLIETPEAQEIAMRLFPLIEDDEDDE